MARPPLLTRAFVLVFLASLTQGLAFNLFLHLPGFLHDLGADDLQIGLLFGVAAAVGIGARAPVGPLMDRRGRRGVVLLGGVMHTAVCGLHLLLSQMGPAVYALRAAHGLAEALLFTSLFTLAADLVPAQRRTEGLALFGVSGMLPIALGGLLGDWILPLWGFSALFLTATAFAALSLLFSLPLPERPAPEAGAPPGRGFLSALLQPDLLPLWWVGGTFALALSSAFTFLKRFVDVTGVGSVGDFFAAYAAAALVWRVIFGWLPDRVGPKRVLFPALGCLALGFAVLAGAADSGDVVLAGILCGTGHGYTFPILFSLVVTRVRESDRGSAMAIFTALFDLGVVLGGPIFGGLSRDLGFAVTYATAAGTVVVGSAVFALWDRGR